MQLTLNFEPESLKSPIRYQDKILLSGSCFTEHIADRLHAHKFNVLSNPHGILFNPISVAQSIVSYVDNFRYTENDLFALNELWNSWDHHTRFSGIDKKDTLDKINESQEAAHRFIVHADWVVITLGSAFQYYLRDTGRPVSNNHRAPAQWFEKRLLPIDVITRALQEMIDKLQAANPFVQVLFTISPVRHIRDGVVDNNRSKARLIEAVHEIGAQYPKAHYFPAYELVIDVLRDYRFYDIDFVHPNFLATSVVWEHFRHCCLDTAAQELLKQVQDIVIARSHRTRFPDTNAHRDFLGRYAAKVSALTEKYPFLDLADELSYFSTQ